MRISFISPFVPLAIPAEPIQPTVGASILRSVDKVDREPDTDSTDSPSDYSSLPSPTSETQEQESKDRKGKGHYRGITFEDILPPHLITNAPPPGADQIRRGGRPRSAEIPSTSSSSPPTTTTERRASTSTKRSYPPLKKQHSGGKSRFQATARALVRRLTLSKPKQDSRRRGAYEAV